MNPDYPTSPDMSREQQKPDFSKALARFHGGEHTITLFDLGLVSKGRGDEIKKGDQEDEVEWNKEFDELYSSWTPEQIREFIELVRDVRELNVVLKEAGLKLKKSPQEVVELITKYHEYL